MLGIIAYVVLNCIARHFERISITLYVLAVIFILPLRAALTLHKASPSRATTL